LTVAFDPQRHLVLVPPHRVETSNARRFLQRVLPDSWRFAHQMTLDLARQVDCLAWPGRAEAFDTYFLRQAEAMLRPRGLTELVHGHPVLGVDVLEAARSRLAPDERTARFARWSRSIVAAVLLELDETAEVTNAHHALTYLLSGELSLAKAAASWTVARGMGPVEQALRDLPGYALVLLAASPNDTAERFMARDAFWAAVTSRI
jgi:hypothetical protein